MSWGRGHKNFMYIPHACPLLLIILDPPLIKSKVLFVPLSPSNACGNNLTRTLSNRLKLGAQTHYEHLLRHSQATRMKI